MGHNNQFINPWKEEEIKILKNMFVNGDESEICKFIPNRAWGSIRWKGTSLGLKRNVWLNKEKAIQKPTLTDIEKGYISGIIDGEGYVGFRSRHWKNGGLIYRPSIMIANNNESVLKFIQEKFGGLILKRDARGNHKATFTLELCSKRGVISILEPVEDILIVKKMQCELMLEWCYSRFNRNMKDSPYTQKEMELVCKIKELNVRKKVLGV